jgi:hypothetical protein
VAERQIRPGPGAGRRRVGGQRRYRARRGHRRVSPLGRSC